MARRRNAVFHRFSRMRGLPPDEKMLMQRIGNLMDAALNNRQASNPYEPSKNNPNRVLYPPTGLVAYTGNQTLKLVWAAADSDLHLRYEVEIQNNELGTTVTKTTYTNELRYKGVNGSYTAKVKSIGRNNSSSPIKTIDFTMGASTMQIEGSKNSATELGTMVQDHITIYDGYSVYAWGSVVLDKYAAGSSNETAVFRLWSMEGANQTYDASAATLEQTITMYPATESFSNLDDNARGAGILRPAGARGGSFETSESVMFSPISIETDETEIVYTYFLEAVGRETELDEVNLSLVLWGGFDGIGDNVPQDPWDGGRSDYVFPHLHSLSIRRKAVNGIPEVSDGSWYLAEQPKEFNLIDNAWTLAFWVRLENEGVKTMVSDVGDDALIAAQNVIFRRSSYNASAPYNWNENAIQVTLTGVKNVDYYQYVNVEVYDANGSDKVSAEFWTKCFGNSDPSDAYSYLWGQGDAVSDGSNNEWQFYVICFEGGGPGAGYGGADLTPKVRVYCNTRQADESNVNDRIIANNAMEHINQRVADNAWITSQSTPGALLKELNQDITNDYIYSIGPPGGGPSGLFSNGKYKGDATKTENGSFVIHQMGMWNVAIDNWDGMGFNPGNAEQRDSLPVYAFPWTGLPPDYNQYNDDGRQHIYRGSSLTAIHYLYNQGYGTDIDWKKNSNYRIDGALEYIFAENLIHLWQFGAIPDEYSTTAETLRDTGNYMYGGDVNFLKAMTTGTTPATGVSTNSWSEDCSLADIYSPVRWNLTDQNLSQSDAVRGRLPPMEYAATDGRPNWSDQWGIIQPAGHLNGAGYSDAGTTAFHFAYPGFGLIRNETNSGVDIGWRRPNTTNGTLDEPKTWGPIYESISLQQAEIDTGQDPWP